MRVILSIKNEKSYPEMYQFTWNEITGLNVLIWKKNSIQFVDKINYIFIVKKRFTELYYIRNVLLPLYYIRNVLLTL